MNKSFIAQTISNINYLMSNLQNQAMCTLIAIGEHTFKNDCEICTYEHGDNVHVKSFKVVNNNIVITAINGDGEELTLHPWDYDQLSNYKYLLNSWIIDYQDELLQEEVNKDIPAHDPNDPCAY